MRWRSASGGRRSALSNLLLPTRSAFSHLHHLTLYSLEIDDEASQPLLSPITFPSVRSAEFYALKLLRDESDPTSAALFHCLDILVPQLTALRLTAGESIIIERLPHFTFLESLSLDTWTLDDSSSAAVLAQLPRAPLRHLRFSGRDYKVLIPLDLDLPAPACLESLMLPESWTEGDGWEKVKKQCQRRGVRIVLEEQEYEGIAWWVKLGRPGGDRKVVYRGAAV